MKKSATTRAVIFATQHRQATELLMELMEQSGLVTYIGKINMDMEAPQNLCRRKCRYVCIQYRLGGLIIFMENSPTKPILTPRFIPQLF